MYSLNHTYPMKYLHRWQLLVWTSKKSIFRSDKCYVQNFRSIHMSVVFKSRL